MTTSRESKTPPIFRDAVALAGRALCLAGMLCWLAGATASAQQDPVDPAAVTDAPARYTVEVIVFEYADASSAGNEVFTPPEPLPGEAFGGDLPVDALEEGPVFDDRSPQAAPDDGDGREPLAELPGSARIELERLEPEAFGMQDTWRKLRQLGAYRPILHAAWTQTTHDKSVSPALPLRALGDPPLGLDGSISLYQSRFLHLDVDLALDAGGSAGGNADEETRRSATDRLVNPGSSDDHAGGDAQSGGFPAPPVRYRITEDRIMRDGEVRYFDHPRFGMLARVSRVRPDGESSAAE